MNNDQPVFSIPELHEALRNAQHVVVLTGAGISAESGVPTFRDVMTGLWAQYKSAGPGHSTSLRSQSETGLGVVCLAA